MSAPFVAEFDYSDTHARHVPASFSLAEAERYADEITDHIPLAERRSDRSINKYPINSDRYNLDWRQPITIPLGIDGGALNDLARNGWKKQRDEVRIAYAQRPKPGYIKASIAVIAGHPTGKAGVFGTIADDDNNERLGGGYIAQIVPLDTTQMLL